MLHIEDATIQFENRELFTGFGCRVLPGEVVALRGDSGSGKTSLLRAILGFVPLHHGAIYVDGLQLSSVTAEAVRHRVAYVPQELHLPLEWVYEMVELPFTLRANKGIHYFKAKLMEVWEKLGLESSLYNQRVSQISGGQRQRMMLAVSGLLNKKLLLTDEPTSALDAESAQRVIEIGRAHV